VRATRIRCPPPKEQPHTHTHPNKKKQKGDFWDRRGDLPVAPLNAVVAELQRWRGTPLLLLPGNHDQVDLGGEVHSLAPLAAAAAASPAHVFTRPALWRGALWLPYRRREAELRGAIAAATGGGDGGGDGGDGGVDAVFAHADVVRLLLLLLLLFVAAHFFRSLCLLFKF
jgi:hypothetical protein